MKILVTGAQGQLARAFLTLLKGAHYRVTALDRTQMDIADGRKVTEALSAHNPDIVVNCAAYNLVDNAEEDDTIARRVNAEGVRTLAAECRKNGVFLVHYSTDYVFDGTKEGLYTEDDAPNPLNKYGLSKLSGELSLQEETDDFLLFRVSWVFGEGTQNFLHKLHEWAKSRKVLKIVSDQISIPTYTHDIVNVTMFAVGKGLKGLYHLANSGYASRYEVARYYLEKLNCDTLVLPVPSEYFPSPAKRPYFSALSSQKLSEELNIDMPHWKTGIDRYIEETMTGVQL